MGSFDCFCALCSGPLGQRWVTFGSKKAEWLARRTRRLDLKKRSLAGEDVHQSDEENLENDVAKENHSVSLGLPRADPTEDSESEESGDVHGHEENHSFDPTKLSREEVAWLDQSHVVGLNRQTSGKSVAFVSGRGEYEDYGLFRVKQLGNDPNDPQESQYACYTNMEADQFPTYPFHRACLHLLSRNVGLDRVEDIDFNILYAVFSQNCIEWGSSLELNYGEIEAGEQFWIACPGLEYSVADPGPNPKFTETLKDFIPGQLFARSIQSLNLAPKVRNDPLEVLPYDILCSLSEELSFRDMRSLMQSSWSVFSSTRSSAFWRQKIRSLITPWFWETSMLLEVSSHDETLNWKDLFLWLDSVTQPQFAMSGPFMSIANRRRIWEACRPLFAQYTEILRPESHLYHTTLEAEAVLESSRSLQIVAVTYPVPQASHTVTTQFIHSWKEISHYSSVLDTFWNTNDVLIGISITFSGTNARVFGSTDGRPGSPFYIPAGDWIQELVIYTNDTNMFGPNQDRDQVEPAFKNAPNGTACIRTLTVKLSSGVWKLVRHAPGFTNRRPFVVLPGHHFIGLTGKIAENGEICCLGMLQGSKSHAAQTALTTYTDAQQILWDYSGLVRYGKTENYGLTEIWSHPWLRVHRLTPQISSIGLQSSDADIASDMIPWQVCLWSTKTESYKSLQRISCFQPASYTSCPDPLIAGLQVEWSSRFQRMAGNGGPVPMQDADWKRASHPDKRLVASTANMPLNPFDENSMEHFEIDGAGGEIITEVHVSTDMKAIKLYTNHGRTCYFGGKDKQHWFEYRAEEGRSIVGLACTFGRITELNHGSKTYSCWILSGFGVLTAAKEHLEQLEQF